MKKICLAVVLSFVTVFSVSAQTTDKLNLAATPIKNEAAAEAIKTVDKDSEAKTAEEKKPAASENAAEKKPLTADAEVKKPEVVVTQEVKTAEAKTKEIKTTEVKEAVKTAVPANAPEASKAIAEAVKKPEAPVVEAKKPSLGGLSTGNALVDGYIEEFSDLYKIDPLLIYAQMHQESGFRSGATSSKGASGFMQLMPDTARRFGVTNVRNPKQNIKAGVKYMRWLLDKFGNDPRLALAGYNAGEGSVMKYGNKIPPYRETQNYVKKIMNHYELLSTQNSTLAENE